MKDSTILDRLTGLTKSANRILPLPWGRIGRSVWVTLRVSLGLILPHLFYLALRYVLSKASRCILLKIGRWLQG